MSPEIVATQNKVAQMPSDDVLLKAIEENQLIGTTDQALMFFMHFVASIADKRIDGSEINTAWAIASRDVLGDYPDYVQTLIGTLFNRVIDTIVPDCEVASQAKEFRLEAMQKAEKD